MPISCCALSDVMLSALKPGGALHSLLERVLADETLNMEFRGYDNAINIYYRGGSLFRVEYTGNGYVLSFDTNYCANQAVQLSAKPSLADAIRDMPLYKQAMDFWFAANHKYEREFAQTVVRDNNRHGSISHATDYYIVSFEYPYLDNMSGKVRKSYFDMTAIKWLSQGHVRKDERAPRLALIEMKYGDEALTGTAGLIAHLQSFNNFLSMNSKDMQEMVDDQAEVFQQKCELGLIPDMKNMPHDIKIMPDDIEVIFILANHDPEKTVLAKQLSKINPLNYPFTIKFAFASMMGYGLYEDTMMTLAQLKNRLSCQNVCGDDVPNFYENE